MSNEQDSDRTDDPTPVIPAREFLAEAIGHLSGVLRGTATACDAARGVLLPDTGGSWPDEDAVLDELEELLDDVRNVATGARRALKRVRGQDLTGPNGEGRP